MKCDLGAHVCLFSKYTFSFECYYWYFHFFLLNFTQLNSLFKFRETALLELNKNVFELKSTLSIFTICHETAYIVIVKYIVFPMFVPLTII